MNDAKMHKILVSVIGWTVITIPVLALVAGVIMFGVGFAQIILPKVTMSPVTMMFVGLVLVVGSLFVSLGIIRSMRKREEKEEDGNEENHP